MSVTSSAFGGEINDAARDGNLEKVKVLLKDNPNSIFYEDSEEVKIGVRGWTPLHDAAFYGHKDVAELLLANNAEVDARAENGVELAGFATIVQPAAKAGPALRVIMAAGKFQGVRAAQTPIGSLITTSRRSFQGEGIVSP